MRKNLYIALAAVVLLAGCDKDKDESAISPTAENAEVKFTAGAARTRVVEDTWQVGDQIGVFAMDSEGAVKNGNNNPYEIIDPSTGAMRQVTLADKICYPQGGGALNFYAYYPYNGIPEMEVGKYKVDISDQSTSDKAKASDLIWAQATDQRVMEVLLQFKHLMTRLAFDISAGGVDVTDLTGMTAKLRGIPDTGEFNILNGAVQPDAQPVKDITLNVWIQPTDKARAAIVAFVFPTADVATMSQIQLLLTVGDREFSWSPGNVQPPTEWTGGVSYTYQIKVGKTN